MSQSTFGDDLIDEAAGDIREHAEDSLDAAGAALPEPDAIWTVEADNTLGVLNALRSALDVGDAAENLRDAKKWYTIGERADAFADADDLRERIETLDETIDEIEDAHEHASALASTVPELRGALDDAHAAGTDDGDGAADDGDAGDEATEADAEPAE